MIALTLYELYAGMCQSQFRRRNMFSVRFVYMLRQDPEPVLLKPLREDRSLDYTVTIVIGDDL